MTMRTLPRLLLQGVAALLPLRLAAQERRACSYTACALRVEATLTGARIVRGAADERVTNVSVGGRSLEPLFQGSDSAMRYLRLYQGTKRHGVMVRAAGAALVVFSLREAWRSDDPGYYALTAAGALTVGIGHRRVQRADNALRKAVWWYNEGLPR